MCTKKAGKEGIQEFLEIGPKSVLKAFVEKTLDNPEIVFLGSTMDLQEYIKKVNL
jgi:hypothetical protein